MVIDDVCTERRSAVNIVLGADMERLVNERVRLGEFRSVEEVVEAALASLLVEDRRGPEAMIDDEFVAYCAREGDDRISMEEVLEATSRIPGSMAEAIIEDERADRI